jgi:plastocyanin
MRNPRMTKTIVTALCFAAITVPSFAADHEISQANKTFSQSDISIRLGERLIFKNNDEVTHNVYSLTPGMAFDLQRQAPGGSSSVSFNKEGTAEVRCSIHPKMKLIVHVQK